MSIFCSRGAIAFLLACLVIGSAGCAPSAFLLAAPALPAVATATPLPETPAAPSEISPGIPAPSSTPDIPPSVTIWWPAALASSSESSVSTELQAQFDDFEAVTDLPLLVRIKRLDGAGGILSTLQTALPVAPAARPDLTLIPRQHMRAAAFAGLIYPLDEVLPASLLQDLYPQARQYGQIDEVTFGLPYLLTLQHTVYRESAFERSPTTFGELLEAGQAFAFPAGAQSGANDTLLIQYTATGGHLVSGPGDPALEEQPLVEVLTFYEQAREAHLIDAEVLNYRQTADYWRAFEQGDLNLAETDSSTYLAAEGRLDSVSTGPIPSFTGQEVTLLDGWVWVLTTPDPGRQAGALAFLEWMMRAENQAALARALHLLPSQWTALRQFGAPPDYIRLVESLLSQMPPFFREEVDAALAAALQDALSAVLTGEETAAQAAAGAMRATWP